MATLLLLALTAGGLAGYLSGRWWAAALALLVPVPFYLGIALSIYGNGFGENWQYGIPLWAIPVLFGFVGGILIRRVWGDWRNSKQA